MEDTVVILACNLVSFQEKPQTKTIRFHKQNWISTLFLIRISFKGKVMNQIKINGGSVGITFTVPLIYD